MSNWQSGQDSNNALPKRFEFIVLSGDETGRDPETRRRVRSVAQANYRRQHPYERRQNTVELDVTPLMDGSLQNFNTSFNRRLPGPTTLLDSSRSDPFQSFGLGGDRRAHRLWDHSLPLRLLGLNFFLTNLNSVRWHMAQIQHACPNRIRRYRSRDNSALSNALCVCMASRPLVGLRE
jgi:hypothetical protein